MVGSRVGHRCVENDQPKGSAREQGPTPHAGEGEWLHPDTRLAQDAKFERCARNPNNSKNQIIVKIFKYRGILK
jgi:hypothetical protein